MSHAENRAYTQRLVFIAVTGTLVFLIAKFTKFPLFPAAPFLKMDFGEVPLLLAAVFAGPAPALGALFLKELLSFLIYGSNPFALMADFAACGCFLAVFHAVCAGRKGPGARYAGILLGAAVRMLFAIPVNLIVLKLQYGMPPDAVMAMMVYILPFNLVKCIADGICAGLLYPRLEKPLEKHFDGLRSNTAVKSMGG